MTPEDTNRETAEAEHPPARSGTPAAWAALALVVFLILGWLASDRLICAAVRTGVTAAAWMRGDSLRIARLTLDPTGSFRAQEVSWSTGPKEHRSTFRCDEAVLTPSSLRAALFPRRGQERRWIRELRVGKGKLLADLREKEEAGKESKAPASATPAKAGIFLPLALLPDTFSAGPLGAVIIGESGRLELVDLRIDLPARWNGRISFRSGTADLLGAHRNLPAGSARARWDSGSLRIEHLGLGEGLSLGELTLRILPDRLDFGLTGTIGKGLLRGDGSFGGRNRLEVTLVGEHLGLESFTGFIKEGTKAAGTIDQARLTFRGDPERPLEADGSLRLVGRGFRWEGRGWESLRVAASLTGRQLTLSELLLRQGENEVLAEGNSSLPADWRAILRAPFTANFQATLQDAGSLAALFGPEVPALGGSLFLDGEVRGSDNRAEGYCHLSGIATRFRNLTMDWLQGCILFEGETTRLSYLEAREGEDRIYLEGSVANSRPHAYKASAAVTVKNFTRRLAQLGLPPTAAVSGGSVSGSWNGEGKQDAHAGTFRARMTDWVSDWTSAGMSGSFEGSYAPGKIELTKAALVKDDLTLSLRLDADTERLNLRGITITRGGNTPPLATGEVSLPLSLPETSPADDLLERLAMEKPLDVHLRVAGLRAEDLALLLGQKPPFAGQLAGDVALKGTPALPDLHADLRVGRLTPPRGGACGDLILAAETAGGATAWKIGMEPSRNTTLSGTLSLPLRLAREGGSLRLSDADVPVSGSIQFRKVSLDDWSGSDGAAFWGLLRHPEAEGDLSVSGSARKPKLAGRLTLNAPESVPVGGCVLQDLRLPFTLSGDTAGLGAEAGARYASLPVRLAGSIGWKNGATDMSMTLQGRDLPLPPVWGVPLTGDADLTLTRKDGKDPVLGGALRLHPLDLDLKGSWTPAFVPPGLPPLLETAAAAAAEENAATRLGLDLSLATPEPSDPKGAGDAPAIHATLRVQGTGTAPSVGGGILLCNQTATLPAGKFLLPEAAVTVERSVPRFTKGTLFGFTRTGFCVLTPTGPLLKPDVSVDGTDGTSAADLMMALALPARGGSSSVPLREGASWLRQTAVGPVCARAWSTSRLGVCEPGALGFYGSPWSWSTAYPPPAAR